MYDSLETRRFVGIGLVWNPRWMRPRSASRHLMEGHSLSGRLFRLVNEYWPRA